MSNTKNTEKARAHEKNIAGLVLAGIGGIAAGALLMPSLLAWGFLHPPRRWHNKSPRSAHGVTFERIRLRAADGVRLSCWYVPPPADIPVRGVVILCHGYWGHRGNMLPHLGFLHQVGYAAVLFDFRAHGWSAGNRVTFGMTEPLDLSAVIDWTKSQPDLADLPLAVIGESMGASATLLVAAKDERIQAVVADSAFSRFDAAIETRLSSLFGTAFAQYASPGAKSTGERLLKQSARDIAPVKTIANISPRPILLLHGTKDAVIPLSCLDDLAAAADPAHTEVWRIDGAAHVRGVYHAADEYRDRILRFLDSALPQPI